MEGKRLRTEAVARLLHQPVETIRTLARCGTVPWAVYIKPKKARYGRGQYLFFAERLSADTGIPIDRVMEAMT